MIKHKQPCKQWKRKNISRLKQKVHLQPKQLKNCLRSGHRYVILLICESLPNVLLFHVRVKLIYLESYRHIFEGFSKKSSMDKRRAFY